MPIYNKYIGGHRFLWVNDHTDDYYSSADVAHYLRWDKKKTDERLRLVEDVDWIEWDELNILISSLTLSDDGTRPFQYDDYPSELVFLTKEGVHAFVGEERRDDVLALLLSDLCYVDTVPLDGRLCTLTLGSYEKTVRLLRMRVVVHKSGSVYTNAGNLVRKLPSHVKQTLSDHVKVWSKLSGGAQTVKRYDCSTWVSYKKTVDMLVGGPQLESVLSYAMGLVDVNLNSITELVDMCKYGDKRQVAMCIKKIQYTNYALKSGIRSMR